MYKYRGITIEADVDLTNKMAELDFEKIWGKDFASKYPGLMKWGVYFSSDKQRVFLSKNAPDWYKVLAYTHETHCMSPEHKNDPNYCRETEEHIVSLIKDGKLTGEGIPENLLEAYIDARLEMFEDCLKVNAGKEWIVARMKETVHYLNGLKNDLSVK